MNYDKQLKEDKDVKVEYNVKFLQTPTVVGLQDFEISTGESIENEVTAIYNHKVGSILPNNEVLTGLVESLIIKTDTGFLYFWTAHKDKRYIARKFKYYR